MARRSPRYRLDGSHAETLTKRPSQRSFHVHDAVWVPKEHAVAEGIAIARKMLARVRGAVQGVQVSAPFGKVELALEVFKA